MGMFDSLYATRDRSSEWQTKAYQCDLDSYFVGDRMPPIDGAPEGWDDYQVEVLGELPGITYAERLATVRGGVLVAVPDERDPSLPQLDYFANPISGTR